MAKYETIAIPFVTIGNKQFLGLVEVYRMEGLKEFIEKFPQCFDNESAFAQGLMGWFFYPDGKPTTSDGY